LCIFSASPSAAARILTDIHLKQEHYGGEGSKADNPSGEKKISIQEALDKEGEQLHISELQASTSRTSRKSPKIQSAEIAR